MRHKQKEWQGEKKKAKVFGLAIFLTLTFSLTVATAQTIYIKQSDGAKAGYALNSIRKITFSSGNLTVTKTDNSTGVYALNEICYLNFKDNTSSVQSISNTTLNMQVYPNPVGDVLNVELPGKGTVQILSLDGKVLQSKQINTLGITTLPTGKLPKGLYMCLYSNGKEIKTAKIIKH
jgi:hypothetical protein